MSKLRVAVIGCGGIANGKHLPALTGQSEKCEIVALCDIILERAQQAAVDFDLPDGQWTLNVITVSYKGGEKQTEGYLNPLDSAATKVLLDTVYEPIYAHFGEEFGKTLCGFFSDEPRLGNIHGAEDAAIGLFVMIPPLYLLADKRPLRRLSSAFKPLTKRESGFVIAAGWIIVLLVFMVTSMIRRSLS